MVRGWKEIYLEDCAKLKRGRAVRVKIKEEIREKDHLKEEILS